MTAKSLNQTPMPIIAHDHSSGGTGGQVDHAVLANVGTNTHAQLDSHVAATTNIHGITGSFVDTNSTQILTNKNLTQPIIGDFSQANHAHTNAASGGQISHTNLTNIGGYTHSDIDIHLNSTATWHGTTGLSTVKPPAISSSTSGDTGASTKMAREDHNHDLAQHAHSGITDGGKIDHAALMNKGVLTHIQIDSKIAALEVQTLTPTYNGITVNGNITITGTVDGVDLSVFYADYQAKVGQTLLTTSSPTFAGLTITGSPNITDFTNAPHAHTNVVSGGQIAHTSLTGIGTNTHAQIDTHLLHQDVTTTASPTFADLTLTGNIKLQGTAQTSYNNGFNYIGSQISSIALGITGTGSVTALGSMYLNSAGQYIASSTYPGISQYIDASATSGSTNVWVIKRQLKTAGIYNDIIAGSLLASGSTLAGVSLDGNLAVLGTISAPKGIVGRTDGATPTTGQIGFRVTTEATLSSSVGAGTRVIGSITLPSAGTWILRYTLARVIFSVSQSATGVAIIIGDNNDGTTTITGTGVSGTAGMTDIACFNTLNVDWHGAINLTITASAARTIYLKIYYATSASINSGILMCTATLIA